jgi:hypothetical protein
MCPVGKATGAEVRAEAARFAFACAARGAGTDPHRIIAAISEIDEAFGKRQAKLRPQRMKTPGIFN